MSERVAEEYLNEICGGIPGRETAEEVRAELLDHLESRIGEYMKSLYDRESAEKKAVEDMGDRKQVREQLSILHRRIPYFDLKNALTKIIVGLLLHFFKLDIGPLSTITTAIGLCFLFVGILQLRKVNRLLGKAWIASIIMISYVFLANVVWVSPLFYLGSEGVWISYVSGAIGGFLLCVCIYFLGKGLEEVLSRPTASSEAASPDPSVARETQKIQNIGGLYFVAYAVAMIGVLIPGGQFFALLPFVILVAIIILRLMRVRGLLLRRQLGYGATDPGKKAWAGLWIAGYAFVFLPFLISAMLFAMPRTFWHEKIVIRENRNENTEIVNEAADSEQQFSNVNPYMQEILQLLPAEETRNINNAIEHDEYYINYSFEETNGIEESYLICRQEDQTILQFVCFSVANDASHGGWDSILIPEWAYPPADPESTSRVYIYTENESGRIFEQRPIALRYGDRLIQAEQREVRDVVCVDYAVAEPGCRQWVIICSTLIDDDGYGNRYVFHDEGPITYLPHLDPLAGYVYVRRSSWFPHSYNESVKRIANSTGMIDITNEIGDIANEIGYIQVYTGAHASKSTYKEVDEWLS
jgi:hypothetical protein